MGKNRIFLTESKLRDMISKVVLNEISRQTMAKAFVKAEKDYDDLQDLQNSGQISYKKPNGKTRSVNYQKLRRDRQREAFANGLGHDLAAAGSESFREQGQKALQKVKDTEKQLELAQQQGDTDKIRDLTAQLRKDRENLYNYNTRNGGYTVKFDRGRYVGDENFDIENFGYGKNRAFKDRTFDEIGATRTDSEWADLDRRRELASAMMGYYDELHGGEYGAYDKNIKDIRRQQRNRQAEEDYVAATEKWKKDKDIQRDYDRMSPLNPKKWFTKRPTLPPYPKSPEYEYNYRTDDSIFGYRSSKSSEYDDEINNLLKQREYYRDAKDNYFNK